MWLFHFRSGRGGYRCLLKAVAPYALWGQRKINLKIVALMTWGLRFNG